jgi:trehalose-phosphatase
MSLPSALDLAPDIGKALGGRRPAIFLDFDGTLSPIASRPELALLPLPTRDLLAALGARCIVCLLSGRALQDLRARVGLSDVYYGADHGRHIVGPQGSDVEHVVGAEARADLRSAARLLLDTVGAVEGVVVETKELSLSVHYRLTPEPYRDTVAAAVAEAAARVPGLDARGGKLVHELLPRDGWDKGRALLWLLERLGLSAAEVCPICLGDDMTDEDMFRAAGDDGISILVGDDGRPTLAQYALAGPEEAARFLALVLRQLEASCPRGVIEGWTGRVGES